MSDFIIKNKNLSSSFIVEPESYEGVKLITDRVALDIELVTGQKPNIFQLFEAAGSQVIIAATYGHSPILDRLHNEGKINLDKISGKREVYSITLIDNPFPEYNKIKQALVISGSDKRGTIYGLFHLSEMCGVSPLIFWGDVVPPKKNTLILNIENTIISKEPSVKYRGFFINDEWPAFGLWCTEKYGGVNAKAYNEVFIFLLRLKGNYMWPAMWRSVFSEEGPGLESAALADTYGVIIGLSHHEPMCRAGAEWQRIYNRYGDDNTWSFITNREAITEFWKDGILRNKPYENLITIGMRGEDDSKLLPENATIADNIQVVKDAILTQHRLIREHINPNLKEVPRMLAIYKEVEDFYYGDGTCEALKDWDELDDVIIMLCEDNYGNTRGLPLTGDRPHPGGYGMYYHFDYHGAPVSYEWQNCSRLAKTRDQMTTAYEHGVRELWIVNVGDIKGMEYPLSYFMDLAFDYDRWSPAETVEEYVNAWVDRNFNPDKYTMDQGWQFPDHDNMSANNITQAYHHYTYIDDSLHDRLVTLLDGWTRWGAARRPEAMNANVYAPCNYREGERVSRIINELISVAEDILDNLPDELITAYETMIYYPAIMTFNNILMNIYAGMNAYYAQQGRIIANTYGRMAKNRILLDSDYTDKYHSVSGGKWNHMMDSAHTGFRTWDDNDHVNPVINEVIPIRGGKVIIGFKGSDKYHLGAHWQDQGPLFNDDMTRPDVNEVQFDIDSRGDVGFEYTVSIDKKQYPWLDVSICSDAAAYSSNNLLSACPAAISQNNYLQTDNTVAGSGNMTSTANNDTTNKSLTGISNGDNMTLTGRVEISEGGHQSFTVCCDKAHLTNAETAYIEISITFDNGTKTSSKLKLAAGHNPSEWNYPAGTYIEHNNYIAIDAAHFSENKLVDNEGFRVIPHLGRMGDAVKAYPVTKSFTDYDNPPYLRYDFAAAYTGKYTVELYLSPTNPRERGGHIRCGISVNDVHLIPIETVSEQLYTEWSCMEWNKGVMNNIRVITSEIDVKKGHNSLFFYAGDPGIILEQIILHRADIPLRESYLGPVESYTPAP